MFPGDTFQVFKHVIRMELLRKEAFDCINGLIPPSIKIHTKILHVFSDDSSVMIPFVSRWGAGLQFISERLKNNREVVIAAVKGDGTALQFALEQFQDDRKIVLIAVKSDYLAIEYASKRLKDDDTLFEEVIQCTGITPDLWAYIWVKELMNSFKN